MLPKDTPKKEEILCVCVYFSPCWPQIDISSGKSQEFDAVLCINKPLMMKGRVSRQTVAGDRRETITWQQPLV